MAEQSLLVLAAATYQVPVILRAQEMGLRVITLDNRPDNPGHALADLAIDRDTTDVSAVLEIARAEAIGGIIAPCTDVALSTAAGVARALDLPSPPVEAVDVLCDKCAFSSHLESLGKGRPEVVTVRVGESLPKVAMPCVVKADRSSGGRGASIVVDDAGLTIAVDQARAAGSGTVLIERFIDGDQLTVEGFLSDGRLAAVMVTDRLVPKHGVVATCGHRVPACLDQAARQTVEHAVVDVLLGLGVTNGPFDADVIWDGQTAWLLEVTPRLGGNGLTTLWTVAGGVDIVEQAIRHALGRPHTIDATYAIQPAGIDILHLSQNGAAPWTSSAAQTVGGLPGVAHVELDVSGGTPCRAFRSGRDRIGAVLATGGDRDEVDARLARAHAYLGLSGTGSPT